MFKILLASLLGAMICVGWGAVSWMVLQWHNTTLHRFADEGAIGAILRTDAGSVLQAKSLPSGVFMLPGMQVERTHAPRDEAAARRQAAEKARNDGPFVYAVVRPGPREMNLMVNMGYAFGRSFVACAIIALMLSWTVRLDYLQRVFFCALGGLFAGAVTDLPMLIWFEAPVRHTLINLADHLCEWFLAGLAIAAFIPGRELWERMR